MDSKILITGGAGFIGSHLTDALIKQGNKVFIYDNLDPQVHPGSQKPDYLNDKAEFIQGDVRDYDLLKHILIEEKFDYIFHFASKVGVGQSQYQINEYMDVNVRGTSTLLDILVNNPEARPKKLIVAASMSSYGEGAYTIGDGLGFVQPPLRSEKQLEKQEWELYGGDPLKLPLTPVPTPENAERNFNSIYAQSKMIQEDMCLLIGKTYEIPTVAVRFFNVFGPRQSLSNPYTGVAAIFMSRIKNNQSPIIFEDGCQTRDFIYVTDVANACITVMKHRKADYRFFNVGSGIPISIVKVADVIKKIYKSKVHLGINLNYRKGDVRHCYADITELKKLGWKPKVSFEEGILRLVKWSRKTEAIDKFAQSEKELREKGLIK